MTPKSRRTTAESILEAIEDVSFQGRFLSRINRRGPLMPGMTTPCHVWNGSKDSAGYGQICFTSKGKHRNLSVARVFLALVGRVLPPGKILRRLCQNSSCLRESHLLETYFSELMNARRHGEGWGFKLTATQVIEIRQSKESTSTLARRFGISIQHARDLRAGKYWEHLDVPTPHPLQDP